MARYLGPKAKLSRREGTDLFLKSASLDRRQVQVRLQARSSMAVLLVSAPPTTVCNCVKSKGQAHVRRAGKAVPPLLRSRRRPPKGNTGANLLFLLESRLDNVVYRMGFGSTRAPKRASWCRTRPSR